MFLNTSWHRRATVAILCAIKSKSNRTQMTVASPNRKTGTHINRQHWSVFSTTPKDLDTSSVTFWLTLFCGIQAPSVYISSKQQLLTSDTISLIHQALHCKTQATSTFLAHLGACWQSWFYAESLLERLLDSETTWFDTKVQCVCVVDMMVQNLHGRYIQKKIRRRNLSIVFETWSFLPKQIGTWVGILCSCCRLDPCRSLCLKKLPLNFVESTSKRRDE